MQLLKAKSRLTMLSLLCAVLPTSCRTALRPITNTADPAAIEMRIVGLRESDRARPELVYSLTGCGSSNATGEKNAENLVQFQTVGVRKDDKCDVKVQTGKSDVGVANWFAEEGLMYEARRVSITSTEGKLSGLAIVQQMYQNPPLTPQTTTPAPAPSVWKVNASMKAPKAFVGICTCTISCTPSLLNNVAMLDASDDKSSGTCQFANLTEPTLKGTTCTRMTVQCGVDFYVAGLPTGTMLDGSLAQESSLPTLMMAQGVPEATSDATIEVVIPSK